MAILTDKKQVRKFIPKKVVIHHSLTKDSGTVSWGAIRNYHMYNRGWSDIGYHAGVELVKSGASTYYEVFIGRMWDVVGAHTRGLNHDSLGLCFIGNYDKEEPPGAMLIVGVKIIRLWMKLYNIAVSDILGHRDFLGYKSCPGTQFDLEKLREGLK